MNNLIKVRVDLSCHESKSGDLYVTSAVYVPTYDKTTGKAKEIIFKPKRNKEIQLDTYQLLCVVYGHNMESGKTLRLNNVQAYLLKGDLYNPYYLIRIRLFEGVALSIFLNNTELDLLTKYTNLNAEFKCKGDYELIPFEAPIKGN